MNFRNFKASHAYAVLVGLFAAVVMADLGYIQAQPTATILGALSSLATLKVFLVGLGMFTITTVIHLVQGSVVAPTVASGGGSGSVAVSVQAPVEAKVVEIHVPPVPPPRNEMGRFLFAGAFGFALSACALFSKVEPPAANFATCVAGDAAKGDSVAVIAVDCGGDALSVIESLISSADPKVTASKAYAEAKATRTALARDGVTQ